MVLLELLRHVWGIENKCREVRVDSNQAEPRSVKHNQKDRTWSGLVQQRQYQKKKKKKTNGWSDSSKIYESYFEDN